MEDYTTKIEVEDEGADISEMHERHRESKSNMAVLIAGCVFLVVLVVTITIVTVTLRNNKDEAGNEFVQNQQYASGDNTSTPEHVQDITESVDPSVVPGIEETTIGGTNVADTRFPERDLNNNALPNYNYTEESYRKYVGYIKGVDCSDGITDEDAQLVIETFACYLCMAKWNESGHYLTVTQKEDSDWYLVYDNVSSTYFHVSPTYNTVYAYMWDMSADTLYKLDVAVCNNYGQLDISYSVNEPQNNVVTVDVWSFNEKLTIDLSSFSIQNISAIQ